MGQAPVFAAMGDRTRLAIVARLGDGAALSISNLSRGTAMTRQAVTKHLRVLQGAGLVRGVRRGREKLFELRPESLLETRRVLETISIRWDEALQRLKHFAEKAGAAHGNARP